MVFKSKNSLREYVKSELNKYIGNPVDKADRVEGADLRFNPLYHLSRLWNEIGIENHDDYLEILGEFLDDDFWKKPVTMFLHLH